MRRADAYLPTTPLTEVSPTWDVVIVGGGVAGTATALSLGGSCRVLIVESGDHRGFRIGESLPPDARPVLQNLGVLEAFLSEGHLPCHGSCSCWGGDRLGYNDYLYNPNGHGWHLDRARFDRFLAGQAVNSGAVLATGARFSRSEALPGGGYELELVEARNSTVRLTAGAVVDASGVSASFARSRGAKRIPDGGLHCRYGLYDLPADGQNASPLTHIEAVEDGWGYLARLPGDVQLAAFFTDPKLARRTSVRDETGWQELIASTRHVQARLQGGTFRRGSLRSHAVAIGYLQPSAGPDWLAVGDAAFACDPILSQGIYAALLAGQRAGRILGSEPAARTGHVPVSPRDAETNYRVSAARTRTLYKAETRWPDSPFWRHRQRDSQPARV